MRTFPQRERSMQPYRLGNIPGSRLLKRLLLPERDRKHPLPRSDPQAQFARDDAEHSRSNAGSWAVHRSIDDRHGWSPPNRNKGSGPPGRVLLWLPGAGIEVVRPAKARSPGRHAPQPEKCNPLDRRRSSGTGYIQTYFAHHPASRRSFLPAILVSGLLLLTDSHGSGG